MNYKSLFICISCILIFSCKDDDDSCYRENIKFNTIEELYECADTPNELNVTGENEFYLITDKDTYNNFVSSSCSFDIDFSKYNLLIGKSSFFPDVYEFYKFCNSDKYILNVISSNSSVAGIYTYHILIKKEILITPDNISIFYTKKVN